ncbi:MAG: TipAS antibiotic-recognition domain-containing protein, partial [Thermomicrobiales bacterium]|nr:TipAS antibiotic-recognition domain-containing protein [Thermomicrobiales bacterium]
RPSARSDAGYRLYAEADLLRLGQILILRALGFRLERIGALLDQPERDPEIALRLQRMALNRRVDDLRRIDAAIGRLLETRQTTGPWDWDAAAKLVGAAAPRIPIEEDEMEKLYTAEQLAAFERVGAAAGPEEIAAIERGWVDLLTRVRTASAAGLNPASAEARALADEWAALTERTMAHYRAEPALLEALQTNYSNGAFESHEGATQAADFAFIAQVNAARG